MKKYTKTKILIISACILCAIAIGCTLAYLVKHTSEIKNNMTVGEAKIDLQEPEWDALPEENKIVYPNRTITKDPQITNVGTTPICAYIKVKIPRAQVRIIDASGNISESIKRDLFTFSPNSNWFSISNVTYEDYTEKVYATYIQLQPGQTSDPLFKTVKFVNIVEGDLPINTDLEIKLTAMAIQADYLDTTSSAPVIKLKEAYDMYLKDVE